MDKLYIDSLEEMNISDEKIKNLIIKIFEEKFKFMHKSNFLRWINRKNISQRIKNITIRIMQEDDPHYNSFAAYYTYGTDRVTYKEEYSDDFMLWDHELNHFVSNFRTHNTFVNEGITQLLTLRTTKETSQAYEENVKYVRLLYRIFGDEVFESYLTDDITFYNKIAKYAELSLDEFDSLSNKANKHYNNTDGRMSKEDFNKFFNASKKIVFNAIKNEMLDFKYYSNGELNFELLKNEIKKFTELFYDSFSDGMPHVFMKDCLFVALSNSYLSVRMKPEEIKEYVEKCVNKNDIDFSPLINLDYKSDSKENLYNAANIALSQNSYVEEEHFDISKFLLDFNTLLNNDSFNKSENEKMQLLYNLLYSKLNIVIDSGVINTILDKYNSMISGFASIRTENKKTISNSKFFEVTRFLGEKAYIEKVDNKFYFIKYNFKEKKFTRKGIGFAQYSYNKDYPKKISFIDRDSSTEYSLLFDESYENFLYRGEKKQFQDGFDKVIDSVIVDELSIIDYKPYIVKVGEDINEGFKFVGTNLDGIDKRIRFIDYKMLLDDIKNKSIFLKRNISNDLITKCINNILYIAYGNMPKDKEMIDNIIAECIKYFQFKDPKAIDKLNEISADLIANFKEYQDSLEVRSLYVLDQKTKSKLEIQKKNSEMKQVVNNFIENNYSNFILGKTKNNVIENEYTYGLKGVQILFSDFEYPLAKKVDFKLFIETIKQEISGKSDKDIRLYGRQYINSFINKICGNYSIRSQRNQSLPGLINDKIGLIYEVLMNSIIYDEEVDNDLLNGYLNNIVELFDKNKELIDTELKRVKIKDDKTKKIYNQIIKIKSDESLNEEEKLAKISALVELNNSDEVNNEYINLINNELVKHHDDLKVRKTRKV